MPAREPAVPIQDATVKGMPGVIGINGEKIAAMATNLPQVPGNHETVPERGVRADENQMAGHGGAPNGKPNAGV